VVTLTLLAGIAALSMSVFIPSLNMMTAHFETSYSVMQLAVAGYLGANALLQVVIGPMSDAWGRRPVILGSLVVFCIATLGCIWATNVWVFLTFRMIQAAIATTLVLSRAAIRDLYDTREAASMIGYVTMGMSLVPMVGPLIGGVLGEHYGWQANFWLLFVLGAAMLLVTQVDFKETLRLQGQPLMAQIRDYPELLTSPRFWGYALACAFASGAFFSYLGGGAYVGDEIYGLEPSQTGFYFGAPAAGYFFGNYLTGRFAGRVGINRLILLGCLASAAGLLLMATLFLSGHGSAQAFFFLMGFVGLGNGLTLPNSTAGMLSVRPHLAGSASGLGGAINLGGGAALSALAGTLLTPETGAIPLIWLMLFVTIASLVCILYVIHRQKRLSGLDA
jgi:DHA1 family bicyclomycin/chloramphenicol resistance-like MFS transporter